MPKAGQPPSVLATLFRQRFPFAKAPLPQITNRASLSRWLNLRQKSDSLAVAFRAVLRMIPQHWNRQTAQSDPGPLPICRCLIIAETALRAPDVDLQQPCFDAFGPRR